MKQKDSLGYSGMFSGVAKINVVKGKGGEKMEMQLVLEAETCSEM